MLVGVFRILKASVVFSFLYLLAFIHGLLLAVRIRLNLASFDHRKLLKSVLFGITCAESKSFSSLPAILLIRLLKIGQLFSLNELFICLL
jgi:hypothetical protein